MIKFGIIGAILYFSACAIAIPLENEISSETNENILPIKNMAKCAEDGGVTGIINCAALRALKSLQHVSKQSVLDIAPGISFTSDNPNIQRIGKELNDDELPSEPSAKASKLFDMLLENTANVVSGRTLKVKLPDDIVESMSRALQGGRPQLPARRRRKGGMKDMFPSFMLGLGAKMFSMVPAVVAGLALFTTKALIIAKLALVLSAIVFFQYIAKGGSIFGSGGSLYPSFTTGSGSYGTYGSYSPPTWTTNNLGGNQYPYKRSIDGVEDSTSSAQDLAYARSKQE